MTVFIVTSGEYSDYHIDAVFLDRQKALQYCAAKGICEDVSIEEWETHDGEIECQKTVNRKYIGYIENGKIRIVEKTYTFDEVKCVFDRKGLWGSLNPMGNNARFTCVCPIDMKIDQVGKAIKDHYSKWAYDMTVELAGENT